MNTSNSPYRCTPVREWPQLDRSAWESALLAPDLLDPEVGFAHRWKASTRLMIESGYGRWLDWLKRTDQLYPDTAPGERATRERVSRYGTELREEGMADNTVAGRLLQLTNALTAIDREGEWAWIGRASSRIYSSAVLVRDPVERMQPPEDVLQLGFDLMSAAEQDRFRTDTDRATLYRDGLLIAFLVLRPLRAANLAGLTLGVQLVQSGELWRIHVGATETKNSRPIDCLWPRELQANLERYLEHHRLQLCKGATARTPPTAALWVSRQGTRMTMDAMLVQVSNRTLEAFGRSINLHTFRHIAATAIATSNPDGARDIQTILGHSTITTSERHYNRAKMLGAGKYLQETIEELRDDD